MGVIEFFEHTADVGMRVRAGNLDDLFRTAAEGLFDYVVVNRAEIQAAEVETVSLQAETPAELLADWLNELIFRLETRHRVYGRFEVHLDTDGRSLEGRIAGEPLDPTRHVLDHEVKAVTHHGLALQPTTEGWVAELILDI